MPEETVSILAVLRDQISAPTSNAGRSLRTLGDDVSSLTSRVTPLIGQLKALVTAYLGFAGARKALAAAREEEDALARLRSALDTNVATFERVVQLASELQRVTRIGDEQVIGLAATLVNRDVPLNKLNDTIHASIQLSAALGMGVESAGEQIAITFQGILPRSIRRSIPELQGLTKEELRLGAAVDLVNQKFQGRAEALAQTPFGRVQQAQNVIGDQLEKIGRILGEAQARILEATSQLFTRIVDFLTGPAGQAVVKFITDVTVKLIENADILFKLFVLLKGIPFVTGLILRMGGAVGTVFRGVSGLERALATGRIEGLMGRQAPITIGAAVTAAVALGAALGVIVNNLANIGPQIKNITDLNTAISQFSERSAEGRIGALEILEGISSTLRLGGRIGGRESQEEIRNQIVRSRQRAEQANRQIEDAVAVARRQEIRGRLLEEAEEFDRLFRETLPEIRREGAEREVEEVKQLELGLIQFLHDTRVISLLDFARERERIERGELQNAALIAQENVDNLREQYEALLAVIREANEATPADLRQLKLVGEQLQAAEKTFANVRRRLEDLDAQAAQRIALAALQNESEARQLLNEEMGRSQLLYSTLQVSGVEVFRRNAQAVEAYRIQVEQSRIALEALAATASDPETSAALRRMAQDLIRSQQEVEATAQTFANSIRDGLAGPMRGFFTETIRDIDNVQEAFSKFLDAIAAKLADFAAGEITQGVLGLLFGSADVGGGGILGGLVKGIGSLFGFAEGGVIPGTPSAGDSVLIAATPGEAVTRRAAAQWYGYDAMDAINRMLIPREVLRGYGTVPIVGHALNTGGVIAGPRPSSPPHQAPAVAIVAPSEEYARRIIRGGKRELFDVLSENPDALRRIMRVE